MADQKLDVGNMTLEECEVALKALKQRQLELQGRALVLQCSADPEHDELTVQVVAGEKLALCNVHYVQDNSDAEVSVLLYKKAAQRLLDFLTRVVPTLKEEG